MYIDEAVSALLERAKEILANESLPGGQAEQEQFYILALDLARQVLDVDTWITRGDHMPARWNRVGGPK